ncbi:MAG: hypothetical protein ACI4U9_01455 [Clostridia bacterium]
MNESKMKNMVVLKNLPSNIVEEAYVVLKPNKNYKNLQKQESVDERLSADYVVKEAEMVISNYLSKIEDKKVIKNSEVEKIKKKYKKLKNASMILAGILILNIIINFI